MESFSKHTRTNKYIIIDAQFTKHTFFHIESNTFSIFPHFAVYIHVELMVAKTDCWNKCLNLLFLQPLIVVYDWSMLSDKNNQPNVALSMTISFGNICFSLRMWINQSEYEHKSEFHLYIEQIWRYVELIGSVQNVKISTIRVWTWLLLLLLL